MAHASVQSWSYPSDNLMMNGGNMAMAGVNGNHHQLMSGPITNNQMPSGQVMNGQMVNSYKRPLPDDENDVSSIDENGTDPDNTGEILHCLFPGCLKEFSSRWSLTRHTRTHTGERPFKCNTCGKEFVQKCSLKRHEQTHSEEKQWLCDQPNCGKRFKLKEYLDVHKRTHVKIDNVEPVVADEDDPVVQDAADAAGALIDQLRQRLVRMSVRHHEQLFAHQQKEQQLTQALKDCAGMLEEAVTLLARSCPEVPSHLVQASMRFSSKAMMNGFDENQ